MLKILLLISFLCYSIAEEQQTTVVGAVSADENKDIRAFAIATNPTEGSITIAGFRSTRNDQGQFDLGVKAEGAAFKWRAQKGSDLGWYYGAAAVNINVDWGKDGTVGKVDAAVCEVAFGVSSICVYEEHNDDKGFQYNVGDKLVCPADSKKDCLVGGACIATQDIDFDLISCTQDDCPNAEGYDDSCTVYTCYSKGTWTCNVLKDTGCPLVNPTPFVVLEATTYFASQPVKIGKYEVGPFKSKTTWKITPPWTSPTFSKVNESNARIVAVTYAAGKSASIEKTAVASDDGLAFAVSGQTTYFSYSPTATVDSTDSSTLITTIPADDIINGDSSDPATKILLVFWKIILSIWKGFGWSVEVIFFSWDENNCDVIIYDPSYGQTGNVDGSALGMAPGLMLPLFISIFQYFYRIF